jgi:uncharacterized protein with FMN-binding domain
MIRRALAIALLSGAALVFAVRFEPPPTGLVEAEGEIVVVTTVTVATTTTIPLVTTTVATTTTAVTIPELGAGIQVVESPLVRMNRGYVQLEVTIFDGYIANIEMIVVPSESRRAREISLDAHDILEREAVQAQAYRLHNVSGATETSRAWMYALKLALIDAGVLAAEQ